MKDITLGYAFCGSFCTIKQSLSALEQLCRLPIKVKPIMSEIVYKTDTRFGTANELIEKVEELCKEKIIHTIAGAEPIGPKNLLDILVVAPCTGNTLAKTANGITDTAVTMAAKAHLRSDRPLIIALASNDAMSANLGNIAALLNRKCVYFVPMRQDDPTGKPHSLVADFSLLRATFDEAMNGKQYRKLFI